MGAKPAPVCGDLRGEAAGGALGGAGNLGTTVGKARVLSIARYCSSSGWGAAPTAPMACRKRSHRCVSALAVSFGDPCSVWLNLPMLCLWQCNGDLLPLDWELVSRDGQEYVCANMALRWMDYIR